MIDMTNSTNSEIFDCFTGVPFEGLHNDSFGPSNENDGAV
jgi:hypothetical protein